MESDLRRLVLMTCLALWALLWGWSFATFVGTEPGGEVSALGSDRMTTFLGWQMAAALPAFAAWVLGRDWPPDSGVRRLSRVPLRLALGLAAIMGGLVLWAKLAG
ncbi:hypothetical protein ACRDNQ_11915 [Palleronia sp. KMU-117]|uniref:hypothetical protein n=1 Tax=Palleronia sp. KMU-117 TaxID=3434108 RepID=UPI003D741C7B